MTYLKRAEKLGKKFQNPVPTVVGGASIFFKVLPLYLKNKSAGEPKGPLGPFHTDSSLYATPPASGLRVTWFGHSASLIELDGMRVLIDPVWDQRASPFTFMGPKRFFQPTIPLEALPPLDVILISHDHYDHLGAPTIKALARSENTAGTRWVTSLGVARHLRAFGVPADRITELDWTESVQVGDLKLTSWPARHFSGRGLTDRFTTLWASFVLEGPQHRVYFGADSGWWDGFGEIASEYDHFDLTMLEIGAFHPLWEAIHLGPDNAARAFEAMQGRASLMMPIHWGLFNLALHPWKQPVERIVEVAGEKGISLWLPVPGQPTSVLPNTALTSNWWKNEL